MDDQEEWEELKAKISKDAKNGDFWFAIILFLAFYTGLDWNDKENRSDETERRKEDLFHSFQP